MLMLYYNIMDYDKRIFNNVACTVPFVCGIFLLLVLHRSGVDYVRVFFEWYATYSAPILFHQKTAVLFYIQSCTCVQIPFKCLMEWKFKF